MEWKQNRSALIFCCWFWNCNKLLKFQFFVNFVDLLTRTRPRTSWLRMGFRPPKTHASISGPQGHSGPRMGLSGSAFLVRSVERRSPRPLRPKRPLRPGKHNSPVSGLGRPRQAPTGPDRPGNGLNCFSAHAPCRGKSTPKLPQNRAQCVRIHAVIEIGCRAFHLKRPPTAGTSKFLCFWPVLEPKGSHPGDPTLTVIAWVCLHFGWVLLLSCCLLLVPPEVCVN